MKAPNESNKNPIGWLKASGTPFEIGVAMGRQARVAVHEYLVPSKIWSMISAPTHSAMVTRLMHNTQSRFPEVYEELRGIAEGLQLPAQDVYAWNCRGEILASVPDGCTTIQTPMQVSNPMMTISHNEDGLPFFRGHCFMLDAKPQASNGFRAFCYPGSLAGHTFGWNDAGLVQSVNNLRFKSVDAMIPRMVLGRAVIASQTLEDALNVLSSDSPCAGFHMTLAQVGNPKLLSVEFGDGQSSVIEITSPSAHTNHALHLNNDAQITTQSSSDRLITAEQLITRGNTTDLEILRTASGSKLPIWRDGPNDPDEENTLATCVFRVSEKELQWAVYADKEGRAVYEGEQ